VKVLAAGVRSSERILVHGAAGGVDGGSAAARQAGRVGDVRYGVPI
jgi:NADPH:quinone reductase-like Zn-dependent oxidoreductase